MNTKNTSSIGIIGSADGPTSILISGNKTLSMIEIVLISLLIFGALYIIFKNKLHK